MSHCQNPELTQEYLWAFHCARKVPFHDPKPKLNPDWQTSATDVLASVFPIAIHV